ncbi:hepatocellular carcinoma-associated antigen 59-domain-containing protein [Sparassis latifolia]
MIKRRTRPPPHLRQRCLELPDDQTEGDDSPQDGDEKLDVTDLIELRKLRRAREGIDAARLTKGDVKKKRKRPREGDEPQGGLRKGADVNDNEEEEEEDAEAKARRVVRTNNFTQQTNVLDVDKHMMAYIEEHMKLRQGAQEESEQDSGPPDPYAELFRVPDRYKVRQEKKEQDEGNVTNSLAMLTAIPEVDLGMDTRLKNIEDTEKAKRIIAEERKERKKKTDDEERLAGSRFYRPNLKTKSDADILRDAKLEAMGMPPDEHRRSHRERAQMATDEMVMERFKKRMRK